MDYLLNVNLQAEVAPSKGMPTNQMKSALANEQRSKVRDFSMTLASGSGDWVVPFIGLANASELFLSSTAPVTVKVNGAQAGFQAVHLWLTGAALTSLSVSNNSGGDADVRIILMEE